MEEHSGEMELILGDLKRGAEEVMHELEEMETILLKMREAVDSSQVNREKMLGDIDDLRAKIGILEHLETKEFNEEKAASNLMIKLKAMIEKCI